MASEDTGRAVQSSKGFYLAQKEIKGVENPATAQDKQSGALCLQRVTGSLSDIPHAADCDPNAESIDFNSPSNSLSVEIDSL